MYKINYGTIRDLEEWINLHAKDGYRFKHMTDYGTGIAIVIEKSEAAESPVEIKVVEPAKPAVEKK